MHFENERLRQQILRIAEQDRPVFDDVFLRLSAVANRPAFLVAPQSYAGMAYGSQVAASLHQVVAAVDDQSTHLDSIHGAPRWSSQEFLAKAAQFPDAIAIDFSCSARGRAFANDLCTAAGIERLSIAPVEDPLIPDFEQRPVFLLHSRSGVGPMQGPGIVRHAGNVVAAIDDGSSGTIHGVPCWSTRQFIEQASRYPQALAVDFSYSPAGRGISVKLCEQANIQRVDAALAIAHCGLASVYEPARTYRQRTLLRLDEFLRFADRLEDDFSVFTLYSNLLFRLTYDSSYLLAAWAAPASEYFSEFADCSTFQLGQREHFCDGGAFQGPIVRKFLDTSRYRYESITAFEPDSINFQKLQGIPDTLPFDINNFKVINKARRQQKLSATPDLSGTVLPLCPITNSAL